jgi:hypothetical protein
LLGFRNKPVTRSGLFKGLGAKNGPLFIFRVSNIYTTLKMCWSRKYHDRPAPQTLVWNASNLQFFQAADLQTF